MDNLHGILTNRAYVGERVIVKSEENAETVQACWPAIVDKDDFERVQMLLKNNRHHPRTYLKQRFPFLLSGLCYCSKCGDSMSGKSAHGNGGKIPYYEHSWSTKSQSFLNKKIFACQPHRILASRLEPLVWEKVSELLTNPEVAKRIIAKAHSRHSENPTLREQEQLTSRINGVADQIDALTEHLSKIPKGVSPEPIYAQMQKLGDKKKEFEIALSELRAEGAVNEIPLGLEDYVAFCKATNVLIGCDQKTEIKNLILRKLIQKVEVLPHSFKIHYYSGVDTVGENFDKLKEIHKVARVENKKAEEDFSSSAFFSFIGSKRLTNGWGSRTRTCE